MSEVELQVKYVSMDILRHPAFTNNPTLIEDWQTIAVFLQLLKVMHLGGRRHGQVHCDGCLLAETTATEPGELGRILRALEVHSLIVIDRSAELPRLSLVVTRPDEWAVFDVAESEDAQ